MSEQWQPAAKLKDELSDKLGDWYLGLDSEDAIYIAEIDSGAVYRIYLPDDLRLCHRVDDNRPRAQLPSAEVIAVIRALVEDAIITGFDYELDINIGAASAWLDSLESETKCPYCLGTGIGVITTEFREDCRECYGTGERQSA